MVLSHKHNKIHTIATYTARKAHMPPLGKKWSHCRKEDDHRPPNKCNLGSQGHKVHCWLIQSEMSRVVRMACLSQIITKKSSTQTCMPAFPMFLIPIYSSICARAFLLGQAPMDNWTLSIEQVSSTLADHNVCTKMNNINAT